MNYQGATYIVYKDESRLLKQTDRILSAMLDGKWRTLYEISQLTNDPESSISAQLRHLTKEEHGGYIKNKRPRGDRTHGLFEYQILPPVKYDNSGQGYFA